MILTLLKLGDAMDPTVVSGVAVVWEGDLLHDPKIGCVVEY